MSRRKTCKRQGCSKPLPPIVAEGVDFEAETGAGRAVAL